MHVTSREKKFYLVSMEFSAAKCKMVYPKNHKSQATKILEFGKKIFNAPKIMKKLQRLSTCF